MKLEMRGDAIYKDGEKQYDFDAFEIEGESMHFFKDEVEVGSVNRFLLTGEFQDRGVVQEVGFGEATPKPEGSTVIKKPKTAEEPEYDWGFAEEEREYAARLALRPEKSLSPEPKPAVVPAIAPAAKKSKPKK